MIIENYESTDGVAMVLIIDEENNVATSMTKAIYDEQQAALEAQIESNAK